MKTLVLLFHPDFARSKANRALADAASRVGGVEIVEMGQLYPSHDLDIPAEVARLMTANRLVLQFPIQWYSTPPLLKLWQDTVLTRMFYVNPKEEGARLSGLPVMVAATAGNDPEAYAPSGINLFPLEELLKPLRSTANRCAFRWQPPFLVYRANKSPPSELTGAGQRYAARLRDLGKPLAA